MAYHAKLSPSSADRWVTCPGSVAMCDGLVDPGNEYSDEGTAAHFLASDCLTHGTHPSSYLGQKILVLPEGACWDAGTTPPLHIFEVTVDMAGYVNHYVQEIRKRAEGGTLLVEQRLPIAFLTGEDDASGTADAVIFAADGWLEVHDLKFGMKVVEVQNNRQLLMYGLAALEEHGMLCEFKGLRLGIHQPRVSPTPQYWEPTAEELHAAKLEIQEAAKVAMSALLYKENWIGKSTAYLTPSEKGCAWCLAKATCPALAKFVTDAVGAEFQELVDTQTTAAVLVGAGPDGAELARKMAAVPLIETWCKAVRAKVEADLFAGVPVPGYKVVQGKRGNRQWTDPGTVEKLFKETFRLKVEEMYDLKLISPTTADKLHAGDTPIIGPRQWKKVEALIAQKDGAPSVAPESDKRPALMMGAAAEEFKTEENIL